MAFDLHRQLRTRSTCPATHAAMPCCATISESRSEIILRLDVLLQAAVKWRQEVADDQWEGRRLTLPCMDFPTKTLKRASWWVLNLQLWQA